MGFFEHDDTPNNRPMRSMMIRRRLAPGAVALVLAATLAACGDSDSSSDTTSASSPTTAAQTQTETTAASNGVADKSADEVLAASLAAAKSASAMHVAGESDGTTIDLSLVKGEGASGSIAQGTNRFELLTVGDEIYLRGSDEFYRSLGGEAVVRLLAGKWLKVSAGDRQFGSFAAFTDMDKLLTEALRPEGTIEKGEVETVDGTEVVPLTNGREGTLYVAATGDPFPVKITPGGARRGEIVFDGWNEPVELTAPTDAIDIEELSRAAG
ncbi:hypothetical protein [Conexibacter woesei]|uniref:Lipoprotein n=1 Tax=Conexibacter woesei (strain DSM 14684 / CCUG 47730 / CIP 108061 / JCM 11494 / NBRC 100937 / ID131577) TaxID=469383 RepID=D3FF54_CONWI|nr:hypothetical protein [Conexibacter woesei]ADB51771.1 hypothetical protein Cwoe_3353 [Conexibacter woesei DSM 14684]